MKASAPVGAGKGLLFITGAKLWFMVAGYVIQFALPRALGSPDKYGFYAAAMAIISTINNVMVTATIQGVSKFSSEGEGRVGSVTRAALRMQLLVGGGTALSFFLLAPWIAAAQGEAALAPALRLGAGVVACYSFYAVFVGAANGARAFHKQAGLDATFSTLRATLVVGAAVLTHSALAAVGGFVGAAAIILALSVLVVGVGEKGEPFDVRRLVRFFGGVAFYLLIVNLLMFVDGLTLKPLVSLWAQRSGQGALAAAMANTQVGLYAAAQNVARIPYQLILAVTFVIFPLVSKSTFDQDASKTRGYVASTMRYSLLVVALLCAVLGARPAATLRLFYPAEYGVGAPALAALLAGYLCFSLFNIAGTIINGAGRTLPTTVIGVATLIVAEAANAGAIWWALNHGRDPLVFAAAATAGAMLLGLALSGAYLYREFGAFLPPLSVARIAAAAAAAVALGRFWPASGFFAGKLGTLASCASCGIVFLIVAVATGELKPSELQRLRR